MDALRPVTAQIAVGAFPGERRPCRSSFAPTRWWCYNSPGGDLLFDPNKHHRRSIRLAGYDYAAGGSYFVTICTRGRQRILGAIVDGGSVLSEHGRLVEACWLDLRNRFPMVELDAHVIMPNHIHGIITIAHGGVAPGDSSTAQDGSVGSLRPFRSAMPHSLPSIIQSFKSESTKAARRVFASPDLLLWQRNYYEHIIRSRKSLEAIRRYINENPLHWHRDPDNPDRE